MDQRRLLVALGIAVSSSLAVVSPSAGIAGAASHVGKATATDWSAMRLPMPANAAADANVNPSAVVCQSRSRCLVIGSYDEQGSYPYERTSPFISALTHGDWSTEAAGLPTRPAMGDWAAWLAGIACRRTNKCIAVGTQLLAGVTSIPFVETESADGWVASRARLPHDAAPAPYSHTPTLDTISCPTRHRCVATGQYNSATHGMATYVDLLSHGRWTARRLPMPKQTSAIVSHATCISVSNCVAAGVSLSASESTLLVDSRQGDGTGNAKWIDTTVPLPQGRADARAPGVYDVACQAQRRCVMVGEFNSDGGAFERPLVAFERHDGTWTAIEPSVPAVIQSLPDDVYFDVACTAGGCLGAGFSSNGDPDHTGYGLILTGHGSHWSNAIAPVPADSMLPPREQIYGALRSGRIHNLFGTYVDVLGRHQPLVLTGTAGDWTAARLPLPLDASTSPGAIAEFAACAAPGSCIAVGYYTDVLGHETGLVEAFNADS